MDNSVDKMVEAQAERLAKREEEAEQSKKKAEVEVPPGQDQPKPEKKVVCSYAVNIFDTGECVINWPKNIDDHVKVVQLGTEQLMKRLFDYGKEVGVAEALAKVQRAVPKAPFIQRVLNGVRRSSVKPS